jgi:dolichol-phosphate mannosyltransferase
MMASAAPFVAVMDGDMQHDEAILPRMFELARSGQADIVIGSRNVEGGSMGEFDAKRVWLSNMGRRLSNAIAGHVVSDPMSGYFLLTRPLLDVTVRRISGVGFKILLDLIASSPADIRIAEVPYTFRTRQFGESKLNIMVGFEYLVLLLDKSVGYTIPVGFALFALVGSVGVLVHFATLTLLFSSGTLSFLRAQAVATLVAMIFNFFLNNVITHRRNRLVGAWSVTRGLLLFLVACSLGALANLAIARLLIAYQFSWAVAAFAGVVIGSVWNYSVSSVLTWHIGQRRARHAADQIIVNYRAAATRVPTN